MTDTTGRGHRRTSADDSPYAEPRRPAGVGQAGSRRRSSPAATDWPERRPAGGRRSATTSTATAQFDDTPRRLDRASLRRAGDVRGQGDRGHELGVHSARADTAGRAPLAPVPTITPGPAGRHRRPQDALHCRRPDEAERLRRIRHQRRRGLRGRPEDHPRPRSSARSGCSTIANGYTANVSQTFPVGGSPRPDFVRREGHEGGGVQLRRGGRPRVLVGSRSRRRVRRGDRRHDRSAVRGGRDRRDGDHARGRPVASTTPWPSGARRCERDPAVTPEPAPTPTPTPTPPADPQPAPSPSPSPTPAPKPKLTIESAKFTAKGDSPDGDVLDGLPHHHRGQARRQDAGEGQRHRRVHGQVSGQGPHAAGEGSRTRSSPSPSPQPGAAPVSKTLTIKGSKR